MADLPPAPQSTNSAAPIPTAAVKPVAAGSAKGSPTLAKPSASRAPVARPAVAPAQVAAPPAPSASESWKKFFNEWPSEIPRRGVVVNQLNEQIPFKAFMIRGDMLMLERTNPDTLGSRFLFVPFAEVGIVKLIDPIKQELFESAGFAGSLAR